MNHLLFRARDSLSCLRVLTKAGRIFNHPSNLFNPEKFLRDDISKIGLKLYFLSQPSLLTKAEERNHRWFMFEISSLGRKLSILWLERVPEGLRDSFE
jgi:hypothetical protein